MRVLLASTPLQEAIATFLLERLVVEADAGVDEPMSGDQCESLQQLLLSQLEVLDVGSFSESLLATVMDAFGAAQVHLRASLAKLLGEMVPVEKCSGMNATFEGVVDCCRVSFPRHVL
jgi:hypothetical protein